MVDSGGDSGRESAVEGFGSDCRQVNELSAVGSAGKLR